MGEEVIEVVNFEAVGQTEENVAAVLGEEVGEEERRETTNVSEEEEEDDNDVDDVDEETNDANENGNTYITL